jgi:hypothetical protein
MAITLQCDAGYGPVSLAKTLGVLSFTPLTMLQACAQAIDFKVGHHFGEGQASLRIARILRGLLSGIKAS